MDIDKKSTISYYLEQIGKAKDREQQDKYINLLKAQYSMYDVLEFIWFCEDISYSNEYLIKGYLVRIRYRMSEDYKA